MEPGGWKLTSASAPHPRGPGEHPQLLEGTWEVTHHRAPWGSPPSESLGLEARRPEDLVSEHSLASFLGN